MLPIKRSGELFKRSVHCQQSPRSIAGKATVADKGQRPVGWVGPRYSPRQITHDLPLGEKNLYLVRVGQFQRAQDEAFGFEFGNHSAAFTWFPAYC